MPPPSATCACCSLSGDQRNPTARFTSSFSLCPLPFCPAVLDFKLPDSTYIHSLRHSLEFTLPQLLIVLFKYCPVISISHIVSKAVILSTLHSFPNHLIANNTSFRLTSTQSSHIANISIKQIHQYLQIPSAILPNATLIPGFGPGGPQPRMRPRSSDPPTITYKAQARPC